MPIIQVFPVPVRDSFCSSPRPFRHSSVAYYTSVSVHTFPPQRGLECNHNISTYPQVSGEQGLLVLPCHPPLWINVDICSDLIIEVRPICTLGADAVEDQGNLDESGNRGEYNWGSQGDLLGLLSRPRRESGPLNTTHRTGDGLDGF